jgi:hypothetical protein
MNVNSRRGCRTPHGVFPETPENLLISAYALTTFCSGMSHYDEGLDLKQTSSRRPSSQCLLMGIALLTHRFPTFLGCSFQWRIVSFLG